MYRLAKSPGSLIQIFTSLCLSHVKEQLTENLIQTRENPTSFAMNGQLFTYIHNRSIILDESLLKYGIELNLRDSLN
ncbi:MAG: hypothetical protein JWP81_3849 [Ferruginibacter sp.]|nr:hypothetical protein [Ferruginibacter sp.]